MKKYRILLASVFLALSVAACGGGAASAETELAAAHKAFSRTEEDMEGFQKALSELVSALSAEVGEEPSGE